MQLVKGSESLWLPVGSLALPYDLFCVPSPGFAKKTFISYSVTFKDNFRQGLVVGIDLKNQTVLLQGGEVSKGQPGCQLAQGPTAGPGRDPPGLRES